MARSETEGQAYDVRPQACASIFQHRRASRTYMRVYRFER